VCTTPKVVAMNKFTSDPGHFDDHDNHAAVGFWASPNMAGLKYLPCIAPADTMVIDFGVKIKLGHWDIAFQS
jgi:hypothetical protein